MTPPVTTPSPQYNNDDEIDLFELFMVLWKGKWFVLLTTLVFAIGGFIYASSKPVVYTASATLSPVISLEPSIFKYQENLNLSASKSDVNAIATIKLKSMDLLQRVVKDRNINLTASQIRGAISVSEDRKTGFLTLSATLSSAEQAKTVVAALIPEVNKEQKALALNEIDSSLDQIKNQLLQNNSSIKMDVLQDLQRKLEEKKIILSSREEIFLKTITPAVTPISPNSNKLRLILVVSILLGGTLSCMALLLNHAFIKRKQ